MRVFATAARFSVSYLLLFRQTLNPDNRCGFVRFAYLYKIRFIAHKYPRRAILTRRRFLCFLPLRPNRMRRVLR